MWWQFVHLWSTQIRHLIRGNQRSFPTTVRSSTPGIPSFNANTDGPQSPIIQVEENTGRISVTYVSSGVANETLEGVVRTCTLAIRGQQETIDRLENALANEQAYVFRRAKLLLQQGKISEASHLVGALSQEIQHQSQIAAFLSGSPRILRRLFSSFVLRTSCSHMNSYFPLITAWR
jgi:hypothetical protein